jgi:hypothetical protein
MERAVYRWMDLTAVCVCVGDMVRCVYDPWISNGGLHALKEISSCRTLYPKKIVVRPAVPTRTRGRGSRHGLHFDDAGFFFSGYLRYEASRQTAWACTLLWPTGCLICAECQPMKTSVTGCLICTEVHYFFKRNSHIR